MIHDATQATMAYWRSLNLPEELKRILHHSPQVTEVEDLEQLHHLASGSPEVRCEQGELYGVYHRTDGSRQRVFNCAKKVDMARIGDAILVGDDRESDMRRWSKFFPTPFVAVRENILGRLEKERLVFFVVSYHDVKANVTQYVACVAPAHHVAAMVPSPEFQGVCEFGDLKGKQITNFAILDLTFRNTHTNGKQAAVHFSPNGVQNELYINFPYFGPWKKGPMGILIFSSLKQGTSAVSHCSVNSFSRGGRVFGIRHEAISGGAKSEIGAPIERVSGRIELAYHGVRPDGGGYYTAEELVEMNRHGDVARKIICTLPPQLEFSRVQYVDDIGLGHIAEGLLYMSDAERRAWFVRLDHCVGPGSNQLLERLLHHPWIRALYLNMVVSSNQVTKVWNRLNDNSRVILPKEFDKERFSSEALRINVSSYGARVIAGSPLGLLHVLNPSAYLAWWAISPFLASTPSISGESETGAVMPNEGAGTMEKFNPGTNRDLIAQRIGEIEATKDNMLYTLLPVRWIGGWYGSYRFPQMAAQIICANHDQLTAGKGLKDASHALLGRIPTEALGFDGEHSLPYELFDPSEQEGFGTEGVDQGVNDYILPFFTRGLVRDRLLKHPNKTAQQVGQWVLDNGTFEQGKAIWGE